MPVGPNFDRKTPKIQKLGPNFERRYVWATDRTDRDPPRGHLHIAGIGLGTQFFIFAASRSDF